MPTRAVRPCNYPACNTLVLSQYCAKHKQAVGKQKEQGRLTAHQRGYTWQWHKARTIYLREHPLCVMCEREGRITPANEVDHKVPHGGDMERFWQAEGLQALCKSCHSAKTAREDGGWGRKARQQGT